MNLCFGEILTIHCENGFRLGKIRVRGAIKTVSLDLISDPAVGECVLVCDGVALNRVDERKQPLEFE